MPPFPSEPKAQSLASHLDANASAISGVTSFWTLIHDWLVSQAGKARELIDTPEERKAIEAVVLAKFDELVAPKVPPLLAGVFRSAIETTLDALLVALAG